MRFIEGTADGIFSSHNTVIPMHLTLDIPDDLPLL